MILVVGADLPRYWKGQSPRCLEAAGPGPSAVAQAALRAADALCEPGSSGVLALSAAGDPLRLKLAIRLLSAGRLVPAVADTESLAAEALATLPREYAELLLALRLGEGVLTDEFMEGFLRDSGYVAGIRSIVYVTLADLGLISRDERPRILSTVAAGSCEAAIPDRGAALRASFAARLLLLREKGLIIPSVALYKRMRADAGVAEADAESLALHLDCIAADAVYGPSEPSSEAEAETPLKPMADFLSSYAARIARPASRPSSAWRRPRSALAATSSWPRPTSRGRPSITRKAGRRSLPPERKAH